MRTKIIIPSQTLDLNLSDLKIGSKDLHEILREIHKKVLEVVTDISLESQSDNPNYSDIDAPLHGVLNILEELNIYS